MSTDLDQYTREDLADMIADEQKENTRLTSRLAEVEKERDELLKRREADRFECCVMSAVTGREDGETLTAAVDRVTRELCHKNAALDAAEIESRQLQRSLATAETALASSRALVAAKDEALKATLPFFEEDMPDGPDGELGIVTVAYRRAFKQVVMALTLTPAACAGMVLVDAAELAELRKIVAAFVKRDTAITAELGHAKALLGWAEDNLTHCVQYSEPDTDGSLYRIGYYTRGTPQHSFVKGKSLLECMEKAMTITAQNLLCLDAARAGKAAP